jgi:hypothetical protein
VEERENQASHEGLEAAEVRRAAEGGRRERRAERGGRGLMENRLINDSTSTPHHATPLSALSSPHRNTSYQMICQSDHPRWTLINISASKERQAKQSNAKLSEKENEFKNLNQ